MALLFARYMRTFPAYTDAMIMEMPAARFFAINAQIGRIQAEEEITAISVAHGSKPGDRIQELVDIVRGKKTSKKSSKMLVYDRVANEVGFESQPGEIAALRERQKAAAEQIKKDRKAWLEQLKQQQAQSSQESPA